MPSRNIDLTQHFDAFVDQQVDGGRYENVSEVVRAGLRLLEQLAEAEQQKLAVLKKLVADGVAAIDQGQGLLFSGEKELADFMNGIALGADKTTETKTAI